MNLFILCLFFFYVQSFQDFSDEYYNCINPNKMVNSSSQCTSIKIPESEGYKCCSVKIEFNGNISHSCFPFEISYIKDQGNFSDANKGLESLFFSTGGRMEIECSEDMISIQNYEKMSDEYLNCYKNNINEVDNENECYKYDMENNKCCFIEKIKKDANETIIKDKRCYIIQNDYFTEEKNMTHYLLDNSFYKNLNQITNTTIIIKCKNSEAFYFNGLLENNPDIEDGNNTNTNKKSGLNKGAIAAIIIVVVIILIGIGILIFYYIKKRKNQDNGENVNISNQFNKEKNKNIINNFDNNNINSNNKIS